MSDTDDKWTIPCLDICGVDSQHYESQHECHPCFMNSAWGVILFLSRFVVIREMTSFLLYGMNLSYSIISV